MTFNVFFSLLNSIDVFFFFNKFLILNLLQTKTYYNFDLDFCSIGDLIFYCGIWGLGFGYKHLLFLMVFSEIMLLGLSICFVTNGLINSNFQGYLYGFLILNLAAAESAVGLSLLITIFSIKKGTAFKNLQQLKG